METAELPPSPKRRESAEADEPPATEAIQDTDPSDDSSRIVVIDSSGEDDLTLTTTGVEHEMTGPEATELDQDDESDDSSELPMDQDGNNNTKASDQDIASGDPDRHTKEHPSGDPEFPSGDPDIASGDPDIASSDRGTSPVAGESGDGHVDPDSEYEALSSEEAQLAAAAAVEPSSAGRPSTPEPEETPPYAMAVAVLDTPPPGIPAHHGRAPMPGIAGAGLPVV